MKFPGLKRRPLRDESPDDKYIKWGWYMMGLLAAAWVIYSLFFEK
ncbi:hypothetical protein [Solirubrum puertoriconensis]|nr:hypothetical protein [Solirubrum puertoriconensis]